MGLNLHIPLNIYKTIPVLYIPQCYACKACIQYTEDIHFTMLKQFFRTYCKRNWPVPWGSSSLLRAAVAPAWVGSVWWEAAEPAENWPDSADPAAGVWHKQTQTNQSTSELANSYLDKNTPTMQTSHMGRIPALQARPAADYSDLAYCTETVQHHSSTEIQAPESAL